MRDFLSWFLGFIGALAALVFVFLLPGIGAYLWDLFNLP